MHNIKLIATDLDGTLLNNDSDISDYNRDVLKHCINNGIELIFASGRPFDGLKRYSKYLDNNNYSIVCNGSVITDSEGNIVYNEVIKEKDVFYLMDIAKSYDDVYLHVYNGNQYIVSKEDVYFKNYAKKENITDVVIGFDLVDNYSFSKMLFIGENDVLSNLENYIRDNLDVHTSFSHRNFLEVLAPGINKGTALKWLCDKKGIDRENIIAFGDNYNDIEMIEFAGVGVAMENAEDILKQRADYVALTNEDDGVGKFLKEIIDYE